MPMDSKYTDKIIAYMKRAKRPVTAPEIIEASGSSRQNIYLWLRANTHLVREVGTGRHHAKAYALVDDIDDKRVFRPSASTGGVVRTRAVAREVPEGSGDNSGDQDATRELTRPDHVTVDGDVEAGMRLVVAEVKVRRGVTVVELETEAGEHWASLPIQ